MSDAVKTYKDYYKKFNKKFFNGSLPDVDIKIEKMKGKNAVGEFNYTASLKYSDGKKEKFFDIKKAIFHNKADQHTKDEWDDIIADAYIAMPKEAFKKGKYYWASILLHEMTHVWQRLVSDSMEEKDHGHDFRKKVDEINKKSKNEWRVGYEEISPKLVSDEPINERPEGDENMNESLKAELWVKNVVLKESLFGKKGTRGYQVAFSRDGGETWISADENGKRNSGGKVYETEEMAKIACKKFSDAHPTVEYKVFDSNEGLTD